jgi:serine-type D-Ala-D-Ala carboxypeptidase/endopeptidase (penicillin-binding protein 4)
VVRRTARSEDEAGWVARALVSVVVVALVAAGVVTWRLGYVDDFFSADPAPVDPSASPAAVPAPDGLDLPAVSAAPALDTPLSDPGPVSPAAVKAAVAPYLADEALGGHVTGFVQDLSGAPAVTLGAGDAAMPASTTKLLTSTAALSALGPETTFTTRVVRTQGNRIVLVGGGDPFLASSPVPSAYPARADVVTLAQQTAAALTGAGVSRVRLGYDDSLFSDPTFNPAWPAHYGPEGVVSPITALWIDEGRPEPSSPGRVDDPSAYAAQAFANALRAAGIGVVGTPVRGVAKGGTDLASVSSAPLREIVQHVLETSDNEGAEVLSHQVGLKVSGTASFVDGAAAVTSTLASLGVDTSGIEIHDGSGLSRENRITPAALVGVLAVAFSPDHPELGGVAQGMPVAGFTGSLTHRFDTSPTARGLVRAKTGTLSNVSSLAGIAVDQEGHEMLFALMADDIAGEDETKAQHTLDAAAGALGACSCS